MAGPLNQAPLFFPLAYYLDLFTSEYVSSPNLISWASVNLNLFQDANTCILQMLSAFNLNTAVGVQLDILGAIIGVSRTVSFQPTGIVAVSPVSGGVSYVVGDIVTIVQSGASGGTAKVLTVGVPGIVRTLQLVTQGNGYSVATGLSTTGGTGTGLTVSIDSTASPVLDDDTYRLLLRARIFANHWTGTINSFQAFWSILFPGGQISINDNQNMTATVILSGAFNSIIQDLIENGYIVPQPQAVEYTFTFPTLPILGFDENNALIAGLDIGHFT